MRPEGGSGDAYAGLLNMKLEKVFRQVVGLSAGTPSLVPFALRTVRSRKRAASRRLSWLEKGVRVPPIMILSVTGRCNLSCEGCYAKAHDRPESPEMDAERLKEPLVAFSIDEEAFGVCLAAGRGFIHVSPEGFVEPCPFSPHSDTSLGESTLRKALDSRLLAVVRENSGSLEETGKGCALFRKRGWVLLLMDGGSGNDEKIVG